MGFWKRGKGLWKAGLAGGQVPAGQIAAGQVTAGQVAAGSGCVGPLASKQGGHASIGQGAVLPHASLAVGQDAALSPRRIAVNAGHNASHIARHNAGQSTGHNAGRNDSQNCAHQDARQGTNRRLEFPTAAQAAMNMTGTGENHALSGRVSGGTAVGASVGVSVGMPGSMARDMSSPRNAPREEPNVSFEAGVLAGQGQQADNASAAASPVANELGAKAADTAGKPASSAGKGLSGNVEGSCGCDWWLFVLVVMLLGVGLVMVLSASGIMAESNYGDKYFFFKRQLVFAFGGGICMAVAAMLPRSLLYRLHYPLLAVVLVLVLLTLSPLAPSINGAHRWIPLGPINIQPMEFVKIALALYLAFYMSEKQELVKTFTKGVIPPAIVTGTFCFLLLLQPDFGSAVVLALMLLLMSIAGGTRVIYVFTAAVLGIISLGALAILEPYRMRRLLAFLDPFQDAQNTGYQLVQSLLAIGSGSFFGVGMGASRQKMFYLPEAHNDFIMAVLAEEMGFVGVSVVMLLFLMLFRRCYLIIKGQDELRARYTAFALTLVIGLGFVQNLAVVMGAAPPKGVPMPFLSYGGSNLLAMMICVGLLLNFSRTAKMPH